MNPFKICSIRQNGSNIPLDPNDNSEHIKYYAAVDSTEEKFDFYRKSFVNELVPRGHAVLFHGETGCGKTSLANRCLSIVKQNKWELNNIKQIPYIIYMLHENFGNKSAEQKVDAILQYIHSMLDEQKVTKELYKEFGEQLGNDVNIVLRFLERKMRDNNRIPIIVFPKIYTESEMNLYVSYFRRSNWFLYFETEDDGVAQCCKRNYANVVTYLDVHTLGTKDGEIFVNTRLSLLGEKSKNINFDAGALEEYLKARSQVGGASVKEFQMVCESAYSNAIKENRDTIGFEEIAKAFMSK